MHILIKVWHNHFPKSSTLYVHTGAGRHTKTNTLPNNYCWVFRIISRIGPTFLESHGCKHKHKSAQTLSLMETFIFGKIKWFSNILPLRHDIIKPNSLNTFQSLRHAVEHCIFIIQYFSQNTLYSRTITVHFH